MDDKKDEYVFCIDGLKTIDVNKKSRNKNPKNELSFHPPSGGCFLRKVLANSTKMCYTYLAMALLLTAMDSSTCVRATTRQICEDLLM